MASGHQVALTRAQRMPAPSTHISKAARQIVPAFLQKLYEMVNDPNNAELIRWSDAGDSFFVLDHERFAHEVLGRWFKHRNFSSFVRQLNMYGFHKIPHLQQGVLKSDTETEFWNFAHANFHRGQPDLLCLIQRKKQPQPGEEGAVDLRDTTGGVALLGAPNPSAAPPSTTNPPSLNATLPSGQVLDVHSIVNGIAAIKRHQTTISSELNELKRSNQLLWQESLAARAKHQKQQDIINRILKFLAGVFGSNTAASGAGGSSPGSPVTPGGSHVDGGVAESLGMAPGPRRTMRLMIEDAKRDGPKKSMVEELTEVPMDIDGSIYGDTSYPSIETPVSDPSPAAPSPAPSTAVSEKITITDVLPPYKDNPPTSTLPVPPSKPDHRTSTNGTEISSGTQHFEKAQQTPISQQQAGQISRAVTPVTHSPPAFELDPRLHGLMNQFTPSQLQSLLTILAPQTFTDPSQPVPPSTTVAPSATSLTGLLTPYVQPSSFDFSINPTSQVNPQSSFGATPVPTDGLISFDQYLTDPPKDLNTNTLSPQQLQQSPERLERQWQAAEDIDKDVNALNTSINTLIQTFGLDPAQFEESLGGMGGSIPSETKVDGPGSEIDSNLAGGDSSSAVDFDFDTFFNNLSSSSGTSGISDDQVDANGMDYNDLVSTAFLDEVQTPSSDKTASPLQPMRQVTPELNMGAPPNAVSNTGVYQTTDQNGKNANPTTNATGPSGRKRKSDLDFDALTDVIGGPTSGTSKTANTGTAKSKRRKDK